MFRRIIGNFIRVNKNRSEKPELMPGNLSEKELESRKQEGKSPTSGQEVDEFYAGKGKGIGRSP